ncbi:hypothetical protein H4Q26_007589 [Puccinia striiformis f. sp. tritici PST-130]|nr:hypothetical protein H4Q26_007589 [Puccinia striiformis f. sp. tritici PST-130]
MRKVLRARGNCGTRYGTHKPGRSKSRPSEATATNLDEPKRLSAQGSYRCGTALLTNKIEDNTDPRKLSERISTNQKGEYEIICSVS